MLKSVSIVIMLLQLVQIVDSFHAIRLNKQLSLPSLSLSSISLPPLLPSLPSRSLPSSTLTPENQIKMMRISLISLLSLTYIYTNPINERIAILWEVVRNNSYFRHDLFEPFVAVTSFFFWIHSFYFSEKLGLLKKYSISKRKDNDKSKSGLSSWYSSWLFRELPLYLGPLYFLSVHFDAFKPRRLALLQAAPSIWTIFGQIIGGLFFYDLFFWFTHVPLHHMGTRAYNLLHARHHSNKEVRAVDTIKLTTIEEFVDVGCSIAALRLLNAHPISRCLYNFVITGLLTELHCGYDLPLSPQNVIPYDIVGGSRKHHIHHRHGNVYFQKIFCYLDNWFGFTEKERNKKLKIN